MAVTQITQTTPTSVIAARTTTSTAPTSGTDGFLCGSDGGVVRTMVTYAGSVTAVTLRLYVRNRVSGVWYRGASSADAGALTPASGNDARDWVVGEDAEFTFAVEAISPGTAGNTIAVDVIGVSA